MSDINDYSNWRPEARKIRLEDLPVAEDELAHDEMRSVKGGSLMDDAALSEARAESTLLGKVRGLLGRLRIKSPFGDR